MAKEVMAEYKTLLTKEEYNRIYKHFNNNSGNLQTNYYFDTKRFTLKASDATLRIKKRDNNLILTFERKKGYQLIRIDENITEEDFNMLVNCGTVNNDKIASELSDLIKDQPLINFLTLSTYRMTFNYKKGRIALDKCEYVDTTDYELEYSASNREAGKFEFIEIIRDFGINYKKSQVKLKRAYDALKRKI